MSEHVSGCKQPWKPYPACTCVEILTVERDDALRLNRIACAERDGALRVVEAARELLPYVDHRLLIEDAHEAFHDLQNALDDLEAT